MRICHILHIINSDMTLMIMITGGVNSLCGSVIFYTL